MKWVVDNLIVVSFLLDGYCLVVIVCGEVFDIFVEKGVICDIICILGVNEWEGEWSLNGK